MIRLGCLMVGLVVLVNNTAATQPKRVSDEQMKRWVEKVLDLKPDEQEAAFRAKMSELNPKLDTHAIKIVADQGGAVREVVVPVLYAEDIRPVAVFRDLEKLSAHGTSIRPSKVADLSGLRGLTKLKELDIGSTAVTDLSPLAKLPIEKLWIERTPIRDIRALKELPLTVLVLPAGVAAKDLEVLKGKPLVTFITYGAGPENAKDVRAIFGAAKLETYRVASSNLDDLQPLAGMPLVALGLGDSPRLKSLAPLRGCETLRVVSVSNAPLISDLTPVAKRALVSLQVSGCPGVRDLAPVKEMPGLTTLGVSGSGVTDLGPVAGHTKLEMLWADDLRLKSLKPITGLPKVKSLYLRKTVVADRNFEPVTKLPALTHLFIDPGPATDALVKRIPGLERLNDKPVAGPK